MDFETLVPSSSCALTISFHLTFKKIPLNQIYQRLQWKLVLLGSIIRFPQSKDPSYRLVPAVPTNHPTSISQWQIASFVLPSTRPHLGLWLGHLWEDFEPTKAWEDSEDTALQIIRRGPLKSSLLMQIWGEGVSTHANCAYKLPVSFLCVCHLLKGFFWRRA